MKSLIGSSRPREARVVLSPTPQSHPGSTWALAADRLGLFRSREPAGSLLHAARVLDAATDPTAHEVAIDVQRLAIDATSFNAIRSRCDGDPARMAQTIAQIVAEHGKLQNPWTGSGGVLTGRVCWVGGDHRATELTVGDRVVPLASLIAIPLRLDEIGDVDPTSPHVPVRGRAIVTGAMLCAVVPPDLSPDLALTLFDIYPVASHVRDLAQPGQHVLVLGAGRAGLLAITAARDAVGASGHISAVDTAPDALARARRVDRGVSALAADVTDPGAVASALAEAGAGRADLTLLCATVPGAEGSALLATDERGTVVFFSTATAFTAAALGADAIGSQARLLIPNGLTDDRGGYAIELVRRHPQLRSALEDGP